MKGIDEKKATNVVNYVRCGRIDECLYEHLLIVRNTKIVYNKITIDNLLSKKEERQPAAEYTFGIEIAKRSKEEYLAEEK